MIKPLKDWKIFSKITGLSVLIIVCFIAIFYLKFLPTVEEKLYDDKKNEIKNIVESGHSAIKELAQRAENNEITTEEAKARSKELVASIRFDNYNYLFITDLDANIIMHPIKTELNGTSGKNITDPNGKRLFVEIAEICKKNGNGMVDYHLPKPGSDEPASKVSYAKVIKEWGWIIGSGIYTDDVESEVAALNTEILLYIFIGAIIFFGLGLYIAKMISEPLKKLDDATSKVASGDTQVSIDINSKDETGSLAVSFNKMIETINMQLSYLNNLPTPVMLIDKDFNITYMNKKGAEIVGKDQANLIGKKCYDQFKTDDCNTEKCSCAQAMKFDKEIQEETIARPLGTDIPILYTGIPIKDKNGEIIGAEEFFSDITEIKDLQNYLQRSVQNLLEVMSKFANGDLTVSVNSEKDGDDIAELFEGFNSSVQNIAQIVIQVMQAVQATASSSSEISSSTEQMAAGAQEQSAQAQEVATAVEEMTKTILETSQNAVNAANSAEEAKKVAQGGSEKVIKNKEGMKNITSSAEKTGSIISSLSQKSEEIGKITEVIDEIADQTNLLALNAAIEAARAGDQGRGFAVVADEVRKLAERTTKATKEIAETVEAIQVESKDADKSMKEAHESVTMGMKLTEDVEDALNNILISIENVTSEINQVASASEEQSATAEQISKNLEGINNVTSESAAGIQQVASTAEDLSRLTESLKSLTENFKTVDEGDLQVENSQRTKSALIT